jgi:peptidoglycan-associated lipoprotein
MGHVLLSLMILLAPGCKKKGDTEPVVTAPPPVVKEPPPPPVVKDPPTQAASLSRVYFDFDSSSLTGSTKSTLGKNATVLKDHSDVKVEVQGHCDERGTTEYNLALGQRRASSAKTYLTDQGISPSRLTTISYGEERPLERGGSESAWAQNRRAEFRVTSGGDGMVASSLGN